MGDRYRPPRQWGCIVGLVMGIPLLLATLFLLALEGGLCEARGPNCHAGGGPYGVILLGIVAGSFALAWGLNLLIHRSRNRRWNGAGHVARTIRRFLDGTVDEWEWDDFTSRPLRDRKLDDIRRRAGDVPLPPDEAERLVLAGLADEAETIASAE